VSAPASPPATTDPKIVAHVAPLFVFEAFLVLLEGLRASGFSSTDDTATWWLRLPEMWVYPLQTTLTLIVMGVYWKFYEFEPIRGIGWAIFAGIVGISVWIAPGVLFDQLNMSEGPLGYLGFAPRTKGFNPSLAAPPSTALYWLIVALRFVRLVIVVPLAEEIFWRGFLMRFLVGLDGDYWKVPFGTFHWRSLTIVTALFVSAHASVDYFGATVFGLLMYWLAVKSRSLAACIIMHAVANLLLGVYVLSTEQWGYW